MKKLHVHGLLPVFNTVNIIRWGSIFIITLIYKAELMFVLKCTSYCWNDSIKNSPCTFYVNILFLKPCNVPGTNWYKLHIILSSGSERLPNSQNYYTFCMAMKILSYSKWGTISPGISLTNSCRGVGFLSLFSAFRPHLPDRIASAVALDKMVWCLNKHHLTKHS